MQSHLESCICLLYIHGLLSIMEVKSLFSSVISPLEEPGTELLLFKYSVMSKSFASPWTTAHKTPLSMELSRKEYWSGLPCPPPGAPPNPGIELTSPALGGVLYCWAIREAPGTDQVFIIYWINVKWITSGRTFLIYFLFSHVILRKKNFILLEHN